MIFLSPYIDSGRIGNLQCAHIFSIGKIIASHLPRIPDARDRAGLRWRGCHNSAASLEARAAGFLPSP